MKQVLFSRFGLLVLLVALFVGMMLSNLLFKSVRIDLTEDGLYTLSEGTENILKNLEKETTLKFFFSDKLTEDVPQIRSYAKRVRELLEEYVAKSGGDLKLEVIDPEPFSEEEDLAAEFGLQGVPLNGDNLYLGLAAVNGDGGSEVIPFFQPDRESFLEYDLSKAIYALQQDLPPKVGLISSLEVMGSFDFQNQRPPQPWMVISQLQELFNLQDLGVSFEAIDPAFDLLIVIHPKNLEETQLAALDQFILGGGRALIFVDPYAERDVPSQNNPMAAQIPPSGDQKSDLNALFSAWGIELTPGKILGDAEHAIQVADQYGRRIRHVGLYQYGQDNFDLNSVMMAELETINLGSAGVLTKTEQSTIEFDPLIQSSERAALLDESKFTYLVDPKSLMQAYTPEKKALTIAARISGKASSAYPDGLVEAVPEDWKTEGEINVVVVADTDLLSDRLWVQVQSFFGQQIARPFADNGSFVINTVESLLGSSDLISVRSRGSFVRGFDRVTDIQRDAEERFRQKEEELTANLQRAEQRIFELENQKDENDQPRILNAEQKAELDNIRQEKLDTRKALRNVQHQLNKDIEQLGINLKLINILFVPTLLVCLAVFMQRRRRQ